MRQFFERINEKRVQNQIEKQREQELAQQRNLELIEVLTLSGKKSPTSKVVG